MQALSIGSQLQDGKYIIEKVLGQGGFGITYLAKHELLGTQVAIKEFFFKQYCDRDEATSHVTIATTSNLDEVKRYEEKFLKEAKVIARLNHPNIVKVHDIFKENNTSYYVMDYIEGETLSDIVKRRGALPESEAVEYIRQAGSALQYIHDQKLNHLDVKPANLMLRTCDKKVILIDFGLSKQYDAVSGNQTSTTPVGISHGYAPIEQYKEGGVQEFSPQTDIYALSATLYKLVTGITPPQATVIAAESWNPEFPSSVSSAVINAIKSAMEVQKGKRPASIKDLIDLLSHNEPLNATTGQDSISKNKETLQEKSESTQTIGQKDNYAPLAGSPKNQKENGISNEKNETTKEQKKSKHSCCLWSVIGIFVVTFILAVIFGSTLNDESHPNGVQLNRESNATRQITISSTPKHAIVFIDEQQIGVTPLSYTTFVGTHSIRLEKNGYKSKETTINVTEEESPFKVSVSLTKIDKDAEHTPAVADSLACVDSTVITNNSTFVIVGSICDNHNDPLPGVEIEEKGTRNGTISDIDGNFRLTVNKDARISVSFVGYKTRVLIAQPKMRITLSE